MKKITLALVAALAGAAHAGATSRTLHYTGYVQGLPVMSLAADLAQAEDHYQIAVSYRTTGLWGRLFPAQRELSVQGTTTLAGAQPVRFETNGTARGHVYHALLRFGAGPPHVENQSPPDPRFRPQPIPAAMTQGATDTISAVLSLLRQIAAGGSCARDAHVFDGRMLSDLRVSDAPDQTLSAAHNSLFAGSARRCGVTMQMLAGAMPPRPDGGNPPRPPGQGSAWIAPVGGQMTLVRLSFATPAGAMVFYLDGDQAGR